MKIEEQVCSLELAKKLKSLGVKQNSLFYWGKKNAINQKIVVNNKKYFCGKDNYYSTGKLHCTRRAGYFYSAFTVAELFQLLPEKVCWRITLREKYILSFGDHAEEDENLANALAKMLCYLLEKNLISK